MKNEAEKIDPEVTIIMATYNRSHFLKEALDSIAGQSFQNWECLVVDDGGSDNTEEIVNVYTRKYGRFRYLRRREEYRKGLSGARNHGLDVAMGKYIQFFDDDDIVHPENLTITTRILKENTTYFCRYNKKPFSGEWSKSKGETVQNSEKMIFELEHLDRMITGEIPFASCNVLWDKRCFQGIRYNEALSYAEEWECYSRILAEGFPGISINKVLYYNRKHSTSNTGAFYRKDEQRITSYLKASLLIIEVLKRKKLMNKRLKKFFIRIGFSHNCLEIIKATLEAGKAGTAEIMKYRFAYISYPFLRPLFLIKGKIFNS